ncbi:hypothetical protein [Nakamurella leprariae]|uniref:Uncharacterized protein n=1 Tax=Nakamurella leprariae TaxID=2803911 RepID=A0A939BVB6_9ACTN|nr:hypothetical protein [Nakamurella leprariae]MBM9466358.1 hypothetical protein [Nakamurella leprariae]
MTTTLIPTGTPMSTSTRVIGPGDLIRAVPARTRTLMQDAKGDRARAVRLLLEQLASMGLLTEHEVETLAEMVDLGFAVKARTVPAADAAARVRARTDELVASGTAGPIALAFATAAAASYDPTDRTPGNGATVLAAATAAKKGGWMETLAGAGAVIGTVLGGSDGGALGAAVGSVVGKIVDECLD